MDYLKAEATRHVFFDGLQGTPVNLDRLVGALEAVDRTRLEGYLKAVPEEWLGGTDVAGKILSYFDELKQNLSAAVAQILKVLR